MRPCLPSIGRQVAHGYNAVMHAGSSCGGNAPRLARAAWLALAGLTLVLFAAGLPLYWDSLQTLCSGQACLPEQLPAATLTALANLGLSARRYALLALGVNLAVSLISVVIGVILFWRGPADRAAWTTSLLLVTLPTANVVLLLPTANQGWQLPVEGLGWVTATLLAVVFYTFPNGRFVPGWTRPLAILWTALMAVDNFSPRLAAEMDQSNLFSLAGSAMIASMAIAQVARYRRFSSAVERQQTKWVVVGTALGRVSLWFIPFRRRQCRRSVRRARSTWLGVCSFRTA